MSARVVVWEPGMQSLGRAVVAIGVFDGVHLGHQALLKSAMDEAERIEAKAIALTFDRDPDQVVTPDSAAPQLLSLDDKCRYLARSGVDAVLVVPFTPEIARTDPESFLTDILGSAVDVRAVHVGKNFRFGAGASGDIDTLYVWGLENDAEVTAHRLVEVDGEPVTSTRIRKLVSAGDVEGAAALLGRRPRVSGAVKRGRGQGRELGFPTANIEPMPFAALPADGVYAGIAELSAAETYPAAISVGTPPSFPEARDYLEAHLIGFDGDLYDRHVTLQFVARVRDQRAFGSLQDLTDAIKADTECVAELVEQASVSAGRMGDARSAEPYRAEFLEDGRPVIDDPEALQAAEAAVAGTRKRRFVSDEPWEPVAEPRHLSGLYAEAGYTAAMVVAPLEAAGIPFLWDPYSPEDMPGYRIGYGAIDRTFTLLVPLSRVEEARLLLGLSSPSRDSFARQPSGVPSKQGAPTEYGGSNPVGVPGARRAPRPAPLTYVTWLVIAAVLFFMLFRAFAR